MSCLARSRQVTYKKIPGVRKILHTGDFFVFFNFKNYLSYAGLLCLA